MALTRIQPSGINTTALNALTAGPAVSNIQIANSTYGILDDTALSTSGGYLVINGSKFASGCNVLVGNTPATSVTFVSATQLRAQIPAKVSGTYVVYISNPDGGTAIFVNGVTCSNVPVWSTGSTLANGSVDTSFSINLSAPSDSAVTYTVAAGSSLPSGVTLASNGLLSGTVTGINDETTYNFTVVATDVELQDVSRAFSITITAGDFYYKNTVLHLNGEISSNAWITDASTNKFNFTVNGDTRPSGFSPYETIWSNYFDGTGDYLNISSNAAFGFGTGDFTIEGWYYQTGGSGFRAFASTRDLPDETSSTTATFFGLNGSNQLYYDSYATGINGSTTLLNNTWYHVACVRSGTTVTLYLNGVSQGTVTDGANKNNRQLHIGGQGAIYFITGYLSNFRVLKGTALYTTTFTPPTSSLTAIANTSLLTCQSNRLIDNSTNNFTITKNGDVTVSNFGPFTETDITTGSGYFDGTGDYLTTTSTSTQFNFDTGDFTVEAWVYPISAGTASSETYYHLVGTNGSYSPGQSVNWSFLWNLQGGSKMRFARQVSGTVSSIESNTVTLVYNTWQHWAVVRSSGTVTFYLNGVNVGGGSFTANINITQGLLVNAGFGGDPAFTVAWYPRGYTSNLRILKGTSLYSSNFTPPTSPLTAIANTSLLTLQSRVGENNNRFVDGSGLSNIITRNGNATQGTYSPFCVNGWSNYFDGTGDFLSLADNAALNPGTSDFVMEAWVYIAALTGGNQGINGKGTAGTDGYSLFVTNARVLSFIWNGTGGTTITGGTLNLNQWHHVAVVRNDGVIRLYLDGVGAGSSTACTTDITSTITKYVGQARGGNPILGYISNYRMMKGSRPATYDATSSSLTVPVSPLTAISNTTLLTCRSNGFKDLSTNALSITRNGNASVQPFSPFKTTADWSANTVGGSVYFDGTGDWLSLGNISALALGTGDFTWESWIYLDIDTLPTYTGIYDQRNGTNGVSVIQPVIELTPSNGYAWYVAAANRITSGSAAVRQRAWQHLAVCRSGSTTKMFIDGVQVGSNYTDTNNYPSGTITIGRENDGVNTRNMTGYLSGLRVVIGQALYTTTFTPPTAPPTPISGTSLLLSCTEGGIIDYAGRDNLETVGDAKVRNDTVKYGNNSIYFDGTGDYLLMPSGPDLDFGTGDFTIEMWVNFTNATSAWQAIVSRAYGVAGGWRLYKHNNDNQLRWYHNLTSIILTTNSDIASGVWSHIAVVRSSGTLTIYINGTNRGSASDSNSYNPGTYALEIGSGVVTSSFPMTGYIDDLRITKGVARYTANFTPPTGAFKTR